MGMQFTVYYSQFESFVREMCGLFKYVNLESTIDENVDRINSSGKGIIHINKEIIDTSHRYLVNIFMPILETEDLLKIAGGLVPNDDIPVVNVVNFASVNWSNFQNPVQYVIVREILKTYVLNEYQLPQSVNVIHLLYKYLPDEFKKDNPLENIDVGFRIVFSDSRYNVVFSFNGVVLIVLLLDYDGKQVIQSYYISPTDTPNGVKLVQKDIPLMSIDLRHITLAHNGGKITIFDAVYNSEELLKKYPDGSICHGLGIISIDTGEYWCWDTLIKKWRPIGVIAKITDKEDN